MTKSIRKQMETPGFDRLGLQYYIAANNDECNLILYQLQDILVENLAAAE